MDTSRDLHGLGIVKTALYPGSFNPWHKGHSDILRKALQVFDIVYVGVGINTEKDDQHYNLDKCLEDFREVFDKRVIVMHFDGLLVDHVKKLEVDAVIRGLRNGHDLQYEMNQQYWNEDLGLTVPVVYFICDRRLSHISSSSIRMIQAIKGS